MPAAPPSRSRDRYLDHLPQKLAGFVLALALWVCVRAQEPARAYVPVRVFGRAAPAYAAAGGVYAFVDGSAGARGPGGGRPAGGGGPAGVGARNGRRHRRDDAARSES